jgi:hypothetical protein
VIPCKAVRTASRFPPSCLIFSSLQHFGFPPICWPSVASGAARARPKCSDPEHLSLRRCGRVVFRFEKSSHSTNHWDSSLSFFLGMVGRIGRVFEVYASCAPAPMYVWKNPPNPPNVRNSKT